MQEKAEQLQDRLGKLLEPLQLHVELLGLFRKTISIAWLRSLLLRERMMRPNTQAWLATDITGLNTDMA
jgi:hypothetical protein